MITEDVTWEDTIQLTGTVKISEGAVLTIKPGTNILVNSEEDIRILATDGGQIKAVGTPEEKILFNSTEDQKGDWLGIELSGDTNSFANADGHQNGSEFAYVEINNASTGILIANQGLSISNSTFSNNLVGIKLKETSNIFVGDSEFSGSGEGIATDYEGAGKHRDIFLMRNTFHEGNNGINIIPNQRDIHNIFLVENEFLGTNSGATFGGGGYGSYIGEITVKGNAFAHESRGISVQAYSWSPRETELETAIDKNIKIEGNLFYNSNGISVGYSDGNGNLDITGNHFKNLTGSSAALTSTYERNDYYIANNIFEEIKNAIDLKASSLEVTNNTFSGIQEFAVKNL